MKTSIATVSLSGDLREKLQAIAGAGFDGVEIFENDLMTFDGDPRTVGKIVSDLGLRITAFQPFRDFEGLPEPQRSHAFERAERKFDLMGELGADLMLICSSVSLAALGGIDRLAGDFSLLAERAARRGLRIGYEALAWGRHISDHRDAWEVVRRADHPNVGLILDSFHTLAKGIDTRSICAIPGDRIFLVQLADAPAIRTDLLHWSRHHRNMPGEGELPVPDFMRAIVATGYDGYLSLEIFNDQFRSGSPRLIAKDGHRSLVGLMDRVQREEPDLRPAMCIIPAPAKVEDVAFVEFAVDAVGAEQVDRLLSAMGFSEIGRHISKDVSLWRQGEINIIVNRECQGLAHSSFLIHGTSIYAMGLIVNDAKNTLDRACALGAEPFDDGVGPGEVIIPAIRGVGGGVIFLLDHSLDIARALETDFRRLNDLEDPIGVGLKRIDHIGQTVDHGEMPSWLLYYTTIFQTEKAPLVDVIDPAGVVRSQAITNADGSFRLTLNGADNRRTLAGRFLAECFGSGVQHLAFATSDIFTTAEALRQAGFKSLEISPNYYEDLDARFDLGQRMVHDLREFNILYDRDDDGEFFQLYAEIWGNGFIFEIVERRGYTGYGAPNAPVRLGAQARQLRRADVAALVDYKGGSERGIISI